MTAILERALLDTRVAWARDLFAQIDVDSREGKAVAVWKAATDQGVSRSVVEWLRRAGASRVLTSRGLTESEIPLPRLRRSREWLKVADLECARCHKVAERRSPAQRHCPDCRAILERARARSGMRRARQRSG